jgi:hypothetical protein
MNKIDITFPIILLMLGFSGFAFNGSQAVIFAVQGWAIFLLGVEYRRISKEYQFIKPFPTLCFVMAVVFILMSILHYFNMIPLDKHLCH